MALLHFQNAPFEHFSCSLIRNVIVSEEYPHRERVDSLCRRKEKLKKSFLAPSCSSQNFRDSIAFTSFVILHTLHLHTYFIYIHCSFRSVSHLPIFDYFRLSSRPLKWTSCLGKRCNREVNISYRHHGFHGKPQHKFEFRQIEPDSGRAIPDTTEAAVVFS